MNKIKRKSLEELLNEKQAVLNQLDSLTFSPKFDKNTVSNKIVLLRALADINNQLTTHPAENIERAEFKQKLIALNNNYEEEKEDNTLFYFLILSFLMPHKHDSFLRLSLAKFLGARNVKKYN